MQYSTCPHCNVSISLDGETCPSCHAVLATHPAPAQSSSRTSLHNVAKRQRYFLFALLFLICANIFQITVNAQVNAAVREAIEAEQQPVITEQLVLLIRAAVCCSLLAVLIAWITMFLLARSLDYGVIGTIVCLFLILIPIIGLITMIVVNSKATKKLQDAGYRVGLFGINPSLVSS